MPAYDTLVIPTALYLGDSFLFWNNEIPAVGSASERIATTQSATGAAPGMGFEISFGGAPGAFQINYEVADTDNDSDFIAESGGSINAGLNAENVCRMEISPTLSKFGRLRLVSCTNPVTITAKGTRL